MDFGFARNFKTTSGPLAISNLEAQIAGQEGVALEARLSLSAMIGWIEAIAQRGHLLGRIADVERANDVMLERIEVEGGQQLCGGKLGLEPQKALSPAAVASVSIRSTALVRLLEAIVPCVAELLEACS